MQSDGGPSNPSFSRMQKRCSARTDVAARAPADLGADFTSTAPSRRQEQCLTRTEAAAAAISDLDYCISTAPSPGQPEAETVLDSEGSCCCSHLGPGLLH